MAPTTAAVLYADVLEVIAEYACATVADACALRRAGRDYRRAVDTTIRRLVILGQPGLAPSPRGPPTLTATARAEPQGSLLRVHRDGTELDAVRIALTCDRFKSVARLVVVAFALDGAKDELREGGVCGPRPIAGRDMPPPVDHAGQYQPYLTSRVSFESCVVGRGPLSSRMHRRWLNRVDCVSVTHIPVTDELCALAEARAVFSRLRWLQCTSPSCGDPAVLVRLLTALGTRLTHLSIEACDAGECRSGIACCSRLTHLWVHGLLSSDASSAVRSAVLCSGAPLEFITANLLPADAVELLTRVPTITEAVFHRVRTSNLPAYVSDRLREWNGSSAGLAHSRRVTTGSPGDWASLAPGYATELCTLKAEAPLASGDIARFFPNLLTLSLVYVDPSVAVAEVRLPPSLTRVDLSSHAAEVGAGLLRRLAAHGVTGLPRLRAVDIVHVDPRLDITPLVVFAATLRSLTLGKWMAGNTDFTTDDGQLAAVEAALSQLVALETVSAVGLPDARCFLAGRHTRLRDVSIGSIHAPAVGAPFGRLVAACPRLLRAVGAGQKGDDGWSGGTFGVVGWTARPRAVLTELFRTSYL